MSSFYNPNLTLWENLFNVLIGFAFIGVIYLICHLIEKAKEKKTSNNRKEPY